MIDLVIKDLAACFDHFEPAHVVHTLRCFVNGVFNRLVSAFLGSTGKLDFLVNVITHSNSSLVRALALHKHIFLATVESMPTQPVVRIVSLAHRVLETGYRMVTPPKGMEQWFAPQFDPSKAGGKTGQSPFGQYDGKIPKGVQSKCSEACVGPICYGSAPVHTLWEKEVLLLHGQFEVPPLKPDYRYRVRVNHRAHVGNGGGYAIYINGKLLVEQPRGLGRGMGEQVNGGFITSDFLDQFKGGKVTIAVKSLRVSSPPMPLTQPKTNRRSGLLFRNSACVTTERL